MMTQKGTGSFPPAVVWRRPLETSAAVIMPMPFCESLVPWPRLKRAAEKSCNLRNQRSTFNGRWLRTITFILESFDDLHLLRDAAVMLEHFEQGGGAFVDVGGLCGKEAEKPRLAREEALQKSRHVVSGSPLRSRWLRQGECKRSRGEEATGAAARIRSAIAGN